MISDSCNSQKAKYWYENCCANNIPYIHITKLPKSYTLEWDCITIDPPRDQKLTGDVARPLTQVFHSIFQIVAGGSQLDAFYDGAAFVGIIKRLELGDAKFLAEKYFDLIFERILPDDIKFH